MAMGIQQKSWKELRTGEKIRASCIVGFFLVALLAGLFFAYSDCRQRGNPYSEYKLESFYIENPLSSPTAVLQIYSRDEDVLHITVEAVYGSSLPVAWGNKTVHFESGQRQTVRISLGLPPNPNSYFGERKEPYDKVIIKINNCTFIRE